jgi:hypothetical protein
MPVFMVTGGFQPVLELTLATKIRVNTLPGFAQSASRELSISPARKGVNSLRSKRKDSSKGVG